MCELCWQHGGYTSMTVYIHLSTLLLWNQWTLKVWQASGTGAVESARERRGRLCRNIFFLLKGDKKICMSRLPLFIIWFFFFSCWVKLTRPPVYIEKRDDIVFLPTNDDIPPIRLHPKPPSPASFLLTCSCSVGPFLSFFSFSLAHRRRRRLTRTHQLSPPIRAIHLADIFRVRRDGCHGSRRANEKMKRHKEKKQKRKQFRPAFFFCVWKYSKCKFK